MDIKVWIKRHSQKGQKMVEILKPNQLSPSRMRMVTTVMLATILLLFMFRSNIYAVGSEVSFYEKLNLMYFPIIFFTVFTLFCLTLGLIYVLFWALFDAEGHEWNKKYSCLELPNTERIYTKIWLIAFLSIYISLA